MEGMNDARSCGSAFSWKDYFVGHSATFLQKSTFGEFGVEPFMKIALAEKL
jgi:hypothetical protein